MENEITIKYSTTTVEELSPLDKELVLKAQRVMQDAYAPHSNFKVGASLQMANGEIILGSNQENIAYPSGLCAERVALFYAGANHPGIAVETICIVAKGTLIEKDKMLAPCGGCRQVMVESESRQQNKMRVILVNQNETVSIFYSADSLLPLTFGL